ncbi:hypothetical protein [Actinophytocola sp.]|uniref:hypothetical protein n=1 Tax=Actinophytocola sp. TaxID=1872138 RepID=UPI00389A38AA
MRRTFTAATMIALTLGGIAAASGIASAEPGTTATDRSGLPVVGGSSLPLTGNGLPLVGNLTGNGLPLLGNLTGGKLPLLGGLA